MEEEEVIQVLRDYSQTKLLFPNVNYPPGQKPLILHEYMYQTLREYSLKLLPQLRDVILCFEHFKYSEICNTMKMRQLLRNGNPPHHLIILQLKFLQCNTFLNLGTLGYMHFTDRSYIALGIKEYIEDCFRADLRVLGTCSSGQFEVMQILLEMGIHCEKGDTLITYPVDFRGRLVHFFDPSWMLRKMKLLFFSHDIVCCENGESLTATHAHVRKLYNLPRLESMFTHPSYDSRERSTLAAAKIFSYALSMLLNGFYAPLSDAIPKCPEAKGSKVVVEIIDQLFDAFNSVPGKFLKIPNKKILRAPITATSGHWRMWEKNCPIVQTMRACKLNLPEIFNEIDLINKCGNSKELMRKNPLRFMPSLQDCLLYFTDNEYQDRDSNGDDSLGKLVSNIMGSDVKAKGSGSAIPIDAFIESSAARSEALHKSLESLSEELVRARKHSKHKKLIKKVQALLNTCLVYNTELRDAWGKTPTYEYCSIKLAGEVNALVDDLEDTDKYLTKVLDDMTRIVEKLRFMCYSLFESWLSSISALKYVFWHLHKRHCDEFYTRPINCDTIHRYVRLFREINGLNTINLVLKEHDGEQVQKAACILAFTKEFNYTVTSTIAPMSRRPKKGPKKVTFEEDGEEVKENLNTRT